MNNFITENNGHGMNISHRTTDNNKAAYLLYIESIYIYMAHCQVKKLTSIGSFTWKCYIISGDNTVIE